MNEWLIGFAASSIHIKNHESGGSMRAVLASAVLATALTAISLAATAADTIVVDFDNATGIDQLLGVDQSQTPSRNVGFEGFFWAWNGQGVVTPGRPASVGFLLGNKNTTPEFGYVGGSDPQFVYLSALFSDAYITTDDKPFNFVGAILSSQTPGTLVIVGQERTANGKNRYADVTGAITKITFDEKNVVVNLATNDFRGIDRLLISSLDANGTPTTFQWTLNDFTYAPIPEPGTWALFGLGILMVGFSLRRRNLMIR